MLGPDRKSTRKAGKTAARSSAKREAVAALCDRRDSTTRKHRRSQTDASKARLRRQAHEFVASLPTAIERDTLLVPEWIAESVVQEVERYLNAELPLNFAERLAAKAYHLYPRHRNFKKMLNRPGNRGRDSLFMFMRHWTAALLKRDRNPLFKKLPWSYALGRPLPVTVT